MTYVEKITGKVYMELSCDMADNTIVGEGSLSEEVLKKLHKMKSKGASWKKPSNYKTPALPQSSVMLIECDDDGNPYMSQRHTRYFREVTALELETDFICVEE